MTREEVAQELFERWSFEPKEVISEGYCSTVYLDESWALKVPFQGEEQTSGLRAFLAYPPSIRPAVYEFDLATGAILMERLKPGTNLSDVTIPLEASTEIFAEFAAEVATIPFPDPIPLSVYIERDCELSKHLLHTTQKDVFLHGDLHHWNILRHGNDWKVIDAKGIYGDPAYEAAAFVMNPLDQIQDHSIEYTLHRIELLASSTGFDPKRIVGWSLIRFCPDEAKPDSSTAIQNRQLKLIAAEMGLPHLT